MKTRLTPGQPGAAGAVGVSRAVLTLQLASAGDVALPGEHLGVFIPFQFHTPAGLLNLLRTTTVFGSPIDVTLQELALETFFPADDASAGALRALASSL